MLDLWIVGLDLSLTATGIATAVRDHPIAIHTVTCKLRGHDRLDTILTAVEEATLSPVLKADLVVIEGASYASQGNARWQLAELHGLVKQQLWRYGVRYAVVAPHARAKYATGRGNAGKDEVLLAAERRYGRHVEIRDNNSADALILLAMAADHYGVPIEPAPQLNREALAKVTWPNLIAQGGQTA